MSTEELDQMLGQAWRDKRQYERELAGLNRKLQQAAHHIRTVADAVLRRCEAAEKSSDAPLPPLMISMDAESYVDMATLNELLADQQCAYDSLHSAEAAIERLTP